MTKQAMRILIKPKVSREQVISLVDFENLKNLPTSSTLTFLIIFNSIILREEVGATQKVCVPFSVS